MTKDPTPTERAYFKKLKSTLQSRLDSGETGLTIKYFNNIPKIVSSNNQKN